ncbi:hypothetical protein [Geotalea sp. SG265]|uniref:hypothetical protein n=1 Tax=Geotalea sp. SG265 TaxID=2922867 RepID=UPI001FAFABA0|nr:hypothetical protein [Geotalea sp. SG265]
MRRWPGGHRQKAGVKATCETLLHINDFPLCINRHLLFKDHHWQMNQAFTIGFVFAQRKRLVPGGCHVEKAAAAQEDKQV